MNEKGLLIVVSGPSGAGKGTICKAFLNSHPTVYPSVSTTTRAPRKGEQEGVSYHFVSAETFEAMIERGEFLEHAGIYGNLYGTARKAVEEKIEKGIDVLLEIEMQGARQVKKQCPDGIYVFILPPSMRDLKERIIKRGSETEKSMRHRLSSAYDEIDFIREYDYYIINDELQQAVDVMNAIHLSEKHKVDGEIEKVIEKFKEEKGC